MKPRLLHYLRLEDLEPGDQARPYFAGVPVTYEVINEWFDFCDRLAHGRLPAFDLLTIDFNFEHDDTTPRTKEAVRGRVQDEKLFSGMSWHPDLLRFVGPVSGILIGATLAGINARRDLPCGVAVHTAFTTITLTDFASTMLVTQILLLCGQPLPANNSAVLLEQTINVIRSGDASARRALIRATERFRAELLRRLAPGAEAIAPRLAVRWESIVRLVVILKRVRDGRTDAALHKAEVELDEALAVNGLELYDSKGELHCLDIRSIFADKYIPPGNSDPFYERLPLDLIETGSSAKEAGDLHRFLSEIELNAFCDTRPLFAFFQKGRQEGGPKRSIVQALKGLSPVYHLLALIFAWLEEYGCQYRDEYRSGFDAERKIAVAGGLSVPSRPKQLAALIRFAGIAYGGEPVTLSRLAKDFRAMLDDPAKSSQFPEFRYLRGSGRQPRVALEHLVEHLVSLGAVSRSSLQSEALYSFTGDIPETGFLFDLNQPSLANRLGFNDSNKQLQRILDDAAETKGEKLADFLLRLQDTPLPGCFRALGRDFMHAFWQHRGGEWFVPQTHWPLCLGGYERKGQPWSFAEERKKTKYFVETAKMTVDQIIPPELDHTFEGGQAYCRRDSYYFVGGDFYTLIGQRQGTILIGDVQGHGHPSAYLATEILGFLRGAPELYSQPALMLDRLHSLLCQPRSDSPNSGLPPAQKRSSFRQASLWVGSVDFQNSAGPVLRYASAAHPYARLLRDGKALTLAAGSHILGALPDEAYQLFETTLQPNDVLLLFTDGLVEWIVEEIDERGPDPVELLCAIAQEVASQAPLAPPRDLAAAIWNRIEEDYRPRPKWHDDATLMVVTIK